MFLAVDIGNSNIKIGIFNGDGLSSRFSLETVRDEAAASLSSKFSGRFEGAVESCLICSVVPELNENVVKAIERETGRKPIIVTNNIDLGLKIEYEPLSAAGADRIINSFSAAETYGTPCIVCSFGTAMTIDVVNDDRVLIGGLIAPGIKALSLALSQAASRLPTVEIARPPRVIQNTTVGSLQSGIVNGYLAQFEGLLKMIKKELGSPARVIATGGHAQLVADNSVGIDVVDNDLTLNGLWKAARRLGITTPAK